MEDSVAPIGLLKVDGEDTVALLALQVWANKAWSNIRPLSIDPVQQEARYQLREEEASLLRDFTTSYPDSNWTPPIQARLGQYYRGIGRYSLALQLWDEAWQATRALPGREASDLADQALAQQVNLLAQLGHAEKLEVVLAESEGRLLLDAWHHQLYTSAKASLSAMNRAPEWCYRCGSFAVGILANALTGARDGTRAVAKIQAPPLGFSLQQLQSLGRELGLDLVPVHWGDTPDIVVPSVIH